MSPTKFNDARQAILHALAKMDSACGSQEIASVTGLPGKQAAVLSGADQRRTGAYPAGLCFIQYLSFFTRSDS